MKKIFSIISACIAGLILVFVISTNFIKTNITLKHSDPSGITIFNQSTTSVGNKTYEAGSSEYKKILKAFKDVTNVSVFNRLVNGGTLEDKAEQDLEDRISKWSTDMKLENIVVELEFDSQQDSVVYFKGNSKVISYWSLLYVIPTNTNYDEIIVYFSTTNDTTASTTSYQQCDPIVIHGISKQFKSFVKSFASSVSK